MRSYLDVNDGDLLATHQVCKILYPIMYLLDFIIYIIKTNFLGYSRTKNQSQRPSTRRHHNYEAQELLSIFQTNPLQAMTFVQDRARNSSCWSRHHSSGVFQSVPDQRWSQDFSEWNYRVSIKVMVILWLL